MSASLSSTGVLIDMKTALIAMSSLQSAACAAHLNDQLDGMPGHRGARPVDGSQSHDRFVTAHHAIADAIEGKDKERMFALGCSSDATPEAVSKGMKIAKFLVPFWIAENPHHEGKVPPAAAQTMARVIYEMTCLSATSSRAVLATAARAYGLELMSMNWKTPETAATENV